MPLLRYLFGEPYDTLDLLSLPPGVRPCYDFVSSRLGRSAFSLALRGDPIENPDLDPARMIPGRERK